MSYYLFLDDERFPSEVKWVSLPTEVDWVIVRTQTDFENTLLTQGCPIYASFDNDLGVGCGEGRKCARWMVEQVLDGKLTIPEGFSYTVHSKNVVAAAWITQYLDQFLAIHKT